GGGKQTFCRARAFLNPLAAFLREFSVAADFLVLHSLSDIIHLFSRKRGYVKIDHKRFLPFLSLPYIPDSHRSQRRVYIRLLPSRLSASSIFPSPPAFLRFPCKRSPRGA